MEWWHWVLTIFGGFLTFSMGGGAIAIASAVIRTFFSMRDNMGGIRIELANIRGDMGVISTEMKANFKAGEGRFEQLEARAGRHTDRMSVIERRLDSEVRDLRSKITALKEE